VSWAASYRNILSYLLETVHPAATTMVVDVSKTRLTKEVDRMLTGQQLPLNRITDLVVRYADNDTNNVFDMYKIELLRYA
jgi:hypothetical protein